MLDKHNHLNESACVKFAIKRIIPALSSTTYINHIELHYEPVKSLDFDLETQMTIKFQFLELPLTQIF